MGREGSRAVGRRREAEDVTTGANIVYVADGGSACSWYRCQTPGEELARRGHRVFLGPDPEPERVAAADVVVFLRPTEPHLPAMLESARAGGARVVCDFDDDLWNLPATNPYAGYFGAPEVVDVMTRCAAQADLVTVTTAELGAVIRRFGSEVAVLPNMLPDASWADEPSRRSNPERLVIGWAGGRSHLADLKVLAGVVESVLSRFAHVEFAFAGMDMVPFAEHERIRILPARSLSEYPTLLREFDVALAPVVDDRFNQAKSDLKYLEYAACGLPVVASGAVTYARVVRHGENGLLARNAKDWLKHIARLVEDEDVRASIGDAARAEAKSRFISANVGLWERAYGL